MAVHYVDPAVNPDRGLCGAHVGDDIVGWGDQGPQVECLDCAVIDEAEEIANNQG